MTKRIDLRGEEFNCVRQYFRPGIRVLEIGGGNGLQASLIAATGAEVHSIDVTAQPEGSQMFFPVSIYDGHTIAFPDKTFDLVFSSNVLEHIRHLDAILIETKRVLKTDGTAIHILPTPSWRIWTSLSHYVYFLKRIFSLAGSRIGDAHVEHPTSEARPVRRRDIVKRALRAGPHGEYPSAFSELWYFSRTRWESVFRKNAFDVLESRPSKLFYTGYVVFPWLSLGLRKALSSLLGSSTRIFILRNKP